MFAMQQRLAELGYLTVEYTGMYGEVTMEAVKAFQKANGLTATGEADAETLTVLYSAEAKAADGAEATATPEPGIGNEHGGGHRDNTRRCVKFESLKGRLCRPFLY